MTRTKTALPISPDTSAVGPILQIIETYQAWVATLAGYMGQAANLLEDCYAQQDPIIEQLRDLCATTHSIRRVDFDAIFAHVLSGRRATRQSLASLIERFRAERESAIAQVRDLLLCGRGEALAAWPTIKQRLLSGKDEGAGEIVAALQQIHVEQEEISTALSGLLKRGEKLRIDDLKAVVGRLASRDSRNSAELAALLAVCESAGRNARLTWQRLAG